ncbi:LytR/AlgR family response regulator transcription factor [Aminipila terrae]|uniref:Stage 0 sporulation protein A homolog n=1 Tax=Aminipila terrae TaxID=2697030 RepID=A0A6P1MD74_9FIRM|nr:LytTR family DNA-binding domain-containing protein [Aminipila terrae]QHI72639.1 response regulator [Aminipila terrae]
MIKIAVCDDEEIMRSQLNNKIVAYMENTNCSSQVFLFSNAEELVESSTDYDIIFLDIQMEGMSGMEAARKIREAGGESYIVFITVLKEYVYDAFDVEATDYLLKPVEDERFMRAMDRILHYIEDKRTASLTVQKSTGYKIIRLTDIFYCEVINRKIYIYTKQGVIDYYNKIDELEKQLKSYFVRCHRSYLVNLQYVCGYENGIAQLENGNKIPISRSRQQDFIKAVLNYMKERKK